MIKSLNARNLLPKYLKPQVRKIIFAWLNFPASNSKTNESVSCEKRCSSIYLWTTRLVTNKVCNISLDDTVREKRETRSYPLSNSLMFLPGMVYPCIRIPWTELWVCIQNSSYWVVTPPDPLQRSPVQDKHREYTSLFPPVTKINKQMVRFPRAKIISRWMNLSMFWLI